MENEMKRILVVDDDSVIGEMLKMLLGYSGYEVIFSAKPHETEEIIRNNDIDLVILDMLIADVDGKEVCARLRENESIAQTPILMMSALDDAGSKCIAAGAYDFISKPFKRLDLLAKVNKALQ